MKQLQLQLLLLTLHRSGTGVHPIKNGPQYVYEVGIKWESLQAYEGEGEKE
jgi:hypothetical protein